MRASDRRAVFVGLDAYEAAGGVVLRDLFQQDDGGWLENVALLDRLVAEKLKAEAEKIAAEGWKWIEVATEFPYGHNHGLRKLDGVAADLTAEERATVDALNAEQAKLEADYDGAEEVPDEVDERLGEIETALADFENRPAAYDPADIVRAGVFVGIRVDGALSVDRGYVRPEDEARSIDLDHETNGEAGTGSKDGDEPTTPTVQRAVITIGGQAAEPEDDDDDAVKPLPDRLVMELTAHRTLALRDAVANKPHVAMTALLHKLVVDAFERTPSAGGCLEVSVRHVSFNVQAADLKDSRSAKTVAERHERGKRRFRKTIKPCGIGSRRSTMRAASRCWRTASAMASTPSTRRPTATAPRASRSTGSSAASARPIGSRARLGSTWSRLAGSRKSTIISAACRSGAFSRRCARRRARTRRSSSIT